MKLGRLLMVALTGAILLSFAGPAQAGRRVIVRGHPGWGWHGRGWGWGPRVAVGFYGYPYWGYPYWYAPVGYYPYPAPYPYYAAPQETVYDGRVVNRPAQDAKDFSRPGE